MFDRFTEDAKQSMSLARQAAQDRGHDSIDVHHMLLGLVRMRSTYEELVSMGFDAERLSAEIERLAPRGDATVTGMMPFTPAAKSVLESSMRAAEQLGHDYISPAHLLHSLSHARESIAARALMFAGVTPDAMVRLAEAHGIRTFDSFAQALEVARRAVILSKSRDLESLRVLRESVSDFLRVLSNRIDAIEDDPS